THLYTLSLHDALPIFPSQLRTLDIGRAFLQFQRLDEDGILLPSSLRTIIVSGLLAASYDRPRDPALPPFTLPVNHQQMMPLLERSEEHTSELQSRSDL